MLILPPGHAQRLRAARQFSAREKWMVGSVSVAAVALLLVVLIAVASSGHSSGRGCVDVTIPYSTGGQEIYRCGPRARSLCQLVGAPGGYNGQTARTIATECHKAGLPIGGSG